MDIVHDVETASLKDSESCESPLCTNRFAPSGLKIKPRRFCSEICKQQASIIHRAAVLLSGLPDSAVIAILRSEQEITQISVQLSLEQRTKCGGTAGK
jgi:hypothetical protein